MQTRRQTGLTPLAIVLPHPPLPRRTSSLLSANSSSSLSLAAADPHTPRSCHSPCLLSVYYPPNRNSSDSWTSSNADDSMEFEWFSEQVLLLSRTLDALPAHLVTPFHGPVPPSNLLDKIARGVSQAKGPVDWPHSIRATRVKLLELARGRAKEEAAALERGRYAIKEEVEVEDGVGMDVDSGAANYPYFHEGREKHLTPDVRRPLYRQSSMDFIKPSLEDIKGNTTLTRLSKRLQRSDRLFPNSAYHPYARPPADQDQADQRRSSSPPARTDVPSLISPSTPSSSTLNTISSLSNNNKHVSTPRILRHSASSSMFSTSSVGMGMGMGGGGPLLTDPRLERIRYTDAGSPPAVPPKDYGKRATKRVPAYGAAAQEVKSERHHAKKKAASGAAAVASVPISATYSAVGASVAAVGVVSIGAGKGGGESPTHTRNVSLGSCPSSDEEEKARSKRAKKVKTKSGVGAGVNAGTNVAAVGRREDSVVPSLSPSHSRLRSSSPKAGTALFSPVEEGLVPMRPCEVNIKAKSYPKSSVVERIRGKDEGNKGGNNSKTGTAAPDEQTKVKTKSRSRPLPMNLQRNPSMFGAELPLLSDAVGPGSPVPMSVTMSTFKCTSPPGPGKAKTKVRSPVPEPVPVPALGPTASCLTKKNGTIPPAPAAPTTTTFTSSSRTTASPLPMRSAVLSPSTQNLLSPRPFTLSPAPAPSPAPTQSPSSPLDSPGSPAMQRVRTLRRVRRLATRRISFGSLVREGGEERREDGRDVENEKECLGSAFQLI